MSARRVVNNLAPSIGSAGAPRDPSNASHPVRGHALPNRSCLVRRVSPYTHMHISFYRSFPSLPQAFALSSARERLTLRHSRRAPAIPPGNPLSSVQLGAASDPGHSIPFFISPFPRLISPRLRSPPHKADSNYTRDTGIPPRARSGN